MTQRSVKVDLVDLVSDVIISLGGTFKNSPRLYRDLKISLAIVALEIQNTDIHLALSESPKIWESFERVARALNAAFRGDFVHEKYRRSKAKASDGSPWASKLWHRLLTIGTNFPHENVNVWTSTPYPCLGMVLELLQSSLQQDLRIDDLLCDNHQVIHDLTSLVNCLVEQLESGQPLNIEQEPNEETYPNPLISEAAIRGETSIRHLSQTLYHTLHGNWPCQIEEHEHGGKLGHCLEVKFCLDPQWMARDPDPSRDSFFIILAGSNLIQECRIHWGLKSVVNETNTLACLVDYEDSKDICLRLTEDSHNRLWALELAQPLELLQLEEECVGGRIESLRNLLNILKPTYATKRVLGLILARSLLHLLEGPWIQWSLSIDDISLFCKTRGGHPYPLFDRVFLSTAFKSIDGKIGAESGRQPRYGVHPFPTILALGIALAEIELGDELADIYDQESFAGLKGKPAKLAKKLWEECERRFHLETGLMQAVRCCTDRASFLSFADKKKDTVFADSNFVETYYRKIIRPLEDDLVNGAKWTWDEVNWLQRRDVNDQGVCKVINKLGKNLSLHDRSEDSMGQFEKKQGKQPEPVSVPLSIPGAVGSTSRSLQGPSTSTKISLHANEEIDRHQPLDNQEFLRPRTRDDFSVAIICALPLEANAVLSAFDTHWDRDFYKKADKDPNFYSVGSIHGRNIVLVHPPRAGKAPAANVATACAMSFTKVTLALVVGVCGGVPIKSNNEEILLGDVIVGKGVVQYDHGRQYSDGFKRKIDMEASLGRPNSQIGSVLAALETMFHRDKVQRQIATFLDDLDDDITCYPGHVEDKVFPSSYRHKHREPHVCQVCADYQKSDGLVCEAAPEVSCKLIGCQEIYLVKQRRRNQRNRPLVHVGLMASGDSVVKSATHRDRIAEKENVIGFEMEGAGAWDALPCVVIKSVCDYADSHKNKLWQKYAAITAAGCAKAFIGYW